jgi:hypothetical protein
MTIGQGPGYGTFKCKLTPGAPGHWHATQCMGPAASCSSADVRPGRCQCLPGHWHGPVTGTSPLEASVRARAGRPWQVRAPALAEFQLPERGFFWMFPEIPLWQAQVRSGQVRFSAGLGVAVSGHWTVTSHPLRLASEKRSKFESQQTRERSGRLGTIWTPPVDPTSRRD